MVIDAWSQGDCSQNKYKVVEFAELRVTELTPHDKKDFYKELSERGIITFNTPVRNETKGLPVEVLTGIIDLEKYVKLGEMYEKKG